MMKNYIKSATRNLSRHKTFSILNIFGLSLGLTIGIFILLWVTDELSYDTFHEKHKNTYRLIHESFSAGESMHYSSCPAPLGEVLQERFPEVENMFRFRSFGAGKLAYKENVFMIRFYYYADKEILDGLNFDFVYGDAQIAMKEPSSVIISQSTSQKLFGDVNPIGKTIQSDDVDNYKITGVFKDFPLNSSLNFELIVPFTYLKEVGFSADNWGSFSWQTFLYLKNKKDAKSLVDKMTGLMAEFVDGEEFILKLQSLEDLHFYNMDGSEGRIKYVRIFIIIGIVIILLACINFMNLSTVRAIKRSREIGLRKAIGADKMQLIRLVLSETFIMISIAMLISMSLVELFRPFFNELTGKGISIAYLNTEFLLILIFILLSTTLLSGFYPAFILSSLNPVHALKGVKESGRGKARIRIALVVLQFSITIILISGSITVYQQLKYMNERDLGMATDNIVYVELDETLKEKFEIFRNELRSNPNIEAVTQTFQMPSHNRLSTNISWDGMEEGFNLVMNTSVADHEYIKTFDLELIAGHDFVKGSSSDSAGIIVNEEAVKQMKLKNPVGTKISLWGDGKILGVVKNYNFMPLTEKIQPIALKIRNDGLYRYAVIKIKPDAIQGTLNFIEEKFADYTSNYPFDYHFMNEDFDRLYRFETRLADILKYFTGLAVCIALLGLYGLSAFISEQRTKEVGIKKTLGASVTNLMFSFIIDFCKWVFLAALIASPVSWYILSNWLENYAYRIPLNVTIFVYSGSIAIIVAAITVGMQAFKSAVQNPITALKYE
jgi:putative ABC transport system permease protein